MGQKRTFGRQWGKSDRPSRADIARRPSRIGAAAQVTRQAVLPFSSIRLARSGSEALISPRNQTARRGSDRQLGQPSRPQALQPPASWLTPIRERVWLPCAKLVSDAVGFERVLWVRFFQEAELRDVSGGIRLVG